MEMSREHFWAMRPEGFTANLVQHSKQVYSDRFMQTRWLIIWHQGIMGS